MADITDDSLNQESQNSVKQDGNGEVTASAGTMHSSDGHSDDGIDTASQSVSANVATVKLEDELKKIGQKTYPKALIVPMEALAGGAFAFLNGGSFKVYMASVFGALILMALRFFLTKKGYFEAFCFMASAFVGGLASLLALRLFHASYQEEILAIIATSLILVPGFPLLNGFLDIFKGYIETGLMRSFQALILIISAAFGILGVICVTNFYNL